MGGGRAAVRELCGCLGGSAPKGLGFGGLGLRV